MTNETEMTMEKTMEKNKRPDCYECEHRRPIAGDAHSKCEHPRTLATPRGVLDILLKNPRETTREPAAQQLGIKGNAHGIRQGWFYWPYNFDPVWLEACKGFKQRKKDKTKLFID
jgi:hypothetical protein